MGETQLWVSLLVSLPSPLRGAAGGQGRGGGGGGWANKRLGDKKEVVAAAAARPVRRRLPSAGSLPHAWIVPASLLPPVPPSELGQAAPLSASAQARQHRRFAGPSPAACSPRTFLSPSFFSSLHPSPCRQSPPPKHNDNNTPAASACRAPVYALARCLPACLLLAAPSPPPVAPCRPHGQWERHGTVSAGEIRRCACEWCCPSSVPGERALGTAGQAPAPVDPATPTAKERWNQINSNPHTWCTAVVWGARTLWGRKDPSPPCSVGDSRCSERLRGRRWCPARGRGTALPAPCWRLGKFRSAVTA